MTTQSVQRSLFDPWTKESIQQVKNELLELKRKSIHYEARNPEQDVYMRKILVALTTECRAARLLWKEIESGGKIARRALSTAIAHQLILFKHLYSGNMKTRFYYLNLQNDSLTNQYTQFYFPEIESAVLELRKHAKILTPQKNNNRSTK